MIYRHCSVKVNRSGSTLLHGLSTAGSKTTTDTLTRIVVSLPKGSWPTSVKMHISGEHGQLRGSFEDLSATASHY
jgi:hypothetical protein